MVRAASPSLPMMVIAPRGTGVGGNVSSHSRKSLRSGWANVVVY